jgi:hypothetical protein
MSPFHAKKAADARALVAAALTKWLAWKSPVDFDRLVYCLARIGDHPGGVTPPKTPADELLIKTTWLKVFEQHDTAVPFRSLERRVLTGLLHNNRWHALFEREDTAHAFIFVLARFLWIDDIRGEPDIAILDLARTAMGVWVPPGADTQTWIYRPLAVALFGNAWCDLVYDTRREVSLSALIRETRPSFLPGRLSGSSEKTFVPLPLLDL